MGDQRKLVFRRDELPKYRYHLVIYHDDPAEGIYTPSSLSEAETRKAVEAWIEVHGGTVVYDW